MHKLLAVMLCLAIAGCYEHIRIEDIEIAYENCRTNGGLRQISLHKESAYFISICENGAQFKNSRGEGFKDK